MITSCEPAILRCISSRWPGEGFERLEIVMSEAGAAVQAEQRSRLGVVAHGAVPDLAAGNVEVTLFDFHTALRR